MSTEPPKINVDPPHEGKITASSSRASSSGAAGTDRLKFITTLVGLSGAAALILYFLIWSAVDAFYIPFGIQPEEAGASQALLISRGTTWVISRIASWVLPLVLVLALLLMIRPVGRLYPHLAKHLLPPGSRQRRTALLLVLLVVLAIGWILYVVLTDIGFNCYNLVSKSGASVARKDTFCSELYTLGVRVSDVHAVWLSKLPEGYHQGDRLVFLGQSDGMTTLYDITSQVLLRVPEGTVELTHHYDGEPLKSAP
jgi:hypothetical protein